MTLVFLVCHLHDVGTRRIGGRVFSPVVDRRKEAGTHGCIDEMLSMNR
jgi:hypothetical protein